MLYRLSPVSLHCLTVGIWNGERKKQLSVNLSYIKAKLICKNSQLFFAGVGWLSIYPAVFQWLSSRIDLILYPRVAENIASHDELSAEPWNRFYYHRISSDSPSPSISIGFLFFWLFCDLIINLTASCRGSFCQLRLDSLKLYKSSASYLYIYA